MELKLGPDNVEAMTPEDRDLVMAGENPVAASFQLSWESTPMGALARMQAMRNAEEQGGRVLGPRELNERYPDLPEKFNEPMSEYAAAVIGERHAERRKLEQAINLGPQDTVQGVMNFGASLLPHVIDPVNAAAGLATGVAGTAFAAWRTVSAARKLGIAVEAAEALTWQSRAAIHFAGEVAGNFAVEPLVAAASSQDMTPYSVLDGFVNSLAPAALFTGVGLLAKRPWRFAGRADPNLTSALHDASNGRAARGLDPQVAGQVISRQMALEMNGTNFRPYTHSPLIPDAPIDRPFFAATPAGNAFETADKAPLTDAFGDGVLHLTDNPNAANGAAARAGNPAAGAVHQIDLTGAKILNLDAELPETIAAEFGSGQKLLQKYQALMDAGDDAAIDALNQRVRELGYDGLAFRQDRLLGEAHDPHNVAIVFDQAKVRAGEVTPADRAKVQGMTREDLQRIAERELDPESHFDDQLAQYDQEGVRQVKSFKEVVAQAEAKLEQIRTTTKELLDEFDSANDFGHTTDDAIKRDIEAIRALHAKGEKLPKVLEDALRCVKG